MTLQCRIKKALGIQSTSTDGFCKLNLHCNNKKRCHKCKYFEVSKWYAFVCCKGISDAIQKATEEVMKLGKDDKK